jgi:mono/diheme cytochrome c family protein
MRQHGWLVGGFALAAGPAGARDLPGDPIAGASLAHEVCAVCHLVSDDQTSDPQVGPSFLEVAGHPPPPSSACAPSSRRPTPRCPT